MKKLIEKLKKNKVISSSEYTSVPSKKKNRRNFR